MVKAMETIFEDGSFSRKPGWSDALSMLPFLLLVVLLYLVGREKLLAGRGQA